MEVRQTVFIIDDDSSICDGLCNLFESIGINAENFNSAEEFLDQWDCNKTGCIILDVRLPGMTGLEFQDKMQQAGIELPIIFMTAHGDIPMVRKAMKAGAFEFLTKPFKQEELLDAVRQSFAIDAARRRDNAMLHSILNRVDSLTHREREVMEMVTAGRLNKQIAAELSLSEITVKLHRRHVMEKMKVDSLAELVKLCALLASQSESRALFTGRSGY